MSLRSACVFALLFSPALASAHHGQEFLLVESPGVPHPGEVYVLGDATAALEGDAEEEGSVAPALLFGVAQRAAFELHAHGEKLSGEGWHYQATAPAAHVLLTEPGKPEGMQVGVSFEYEVAADQAAQDNAEVRLSLEGGEESARWGANLIASHEESGESDYEAAFGFCHGVRSGLAFGLEAQGSFRHAAGSELLATAYFEKEQHWAIKFGVGGQREEDDHLSPFAQFGFVFPLKN